MIFLISKLILFSSYHTDVKSPVHLRAAKAIFTQPCQKYSITCFLLFLFHVYECFAQMYVYIPHVYLVLREARRFKSLGTEVIDNCELPCGRWEQNPGSQQEQEVLLITEPSLKPQIKKANISVYKGNKRYYDVAFFCFSHSVLLYHQPNF